MNDSNVIVRAENLDKTYRLYAKPHYRFLDMFGLLRRSDAYTEHPALRGVNLEIRRGEKVAFIGRNGAGKSTLLKLITGVIQPTAGTLQVSQGAHALLQIGSGFHQDFTGRQNALAYLAHLGVSGEKARERLREIVDFAELEDYIDQPIKTYSTGMVARLMFATSTVIEPELLVLDEILGVGDAYFSHKSFERIREMCEANGTTVLLVSHDIYSAAKLCDRMVWIDQGQLVFDGPSSEAIKAYESSVRAQEEQRLRAKKMLQDASAGQVMSVVELAAIDPLQAPIDFQSLAVTLSSGEVVQIPLMGPQAFRVDQAAHLIESESNWGDVVEVDGSTYRQMQTFGTPFNKVAFAVQLPSAASLNVEAPLITCQLRSNAPAAFRATWFDAQRRPRWSGELLVKSGNEDAQYTVRFNPYDASKDALVVRAIGTQRVLIRGARFVDTLGDEVVHLQYGAPVRLLIDYQINDPTLSERPQVTVGIHRDGAVDVCRFICRDLDLRASGKNEGAIEFLLSRMPLSNGRYTVSIMIAKFGYFDEAQTQYFTINPGVYACRSRMLEFEVIGGDLLSSGTVFVGEAQWSVNS